jgi:hypothetical protein
LQKDNGVDVQFACFQPLPSTFPLAVIFQKSTGKAGGFIGWVEFIPKPPKILPRLGTCDGGQEQPEVKALAGRRMDKVHPANDITSTTWLPLLSLLLPNKALREIMIGDVTCTLQGGIGNEPLCKVSLLDCITIQYLLDIIVIVNIDGLLIFKMNRQMIDGRLFLMHGKFHNMPNSLNRTNIMTTYVIKYFVNVFPNGDGSTIVAFVYVLVDVLDGLDRGADFDIYVTVVPCRQIKVIRNDTAVVKGVAFAICISPAVFRPSIFWIAILSRDLGRNDGVNMSGITYFERPFQKEEEIDVGQSTLLKLGGKDKAKNVTEQTTF